MARLSCSARGGQFGADSWPFSNIIRQGVVAGQGLVHDFTGLPDPLQRGQRGRHSGQAIGEIVAEGVIDGDQLAAPLCGFLGGAEGFRRTVDPQQRLRVTVQRRHEVFPVRGGSVGG